MADLLVDTDVFSLGFRFDPLFDSFYGPAIEGHRTVVSFMTVAELEFGMLNRQWGERRTTALRKYLASHYVECGVTNRICRQWAAAINEARSKGHTLRTADAWIAATALALDIPLVTHNARDFSCLSSLELITAPKE